MTRRPDLEARLDTLPGCTWRYERALPVDGIDMPLSENLQYRLDGTDSATVDRYASDMARGDRFPAVVVREVRGGHTLIGGNHRRTAAAKAGIATLDAYVVGCSPGQARQLAFEDNRTHGLPLTATERAVLATRLVLLDGVPTGEAARITGAIDAMVSNALAAIRADRRAADLGLPKAFAAQPVSTRERLGAIDDDGLFCEAARVVLACGVGGNNVRQLVQRLRAAEDIDDAYDRLDAFETSRSARVSHKARNDLNRLSDAVYALLDVDPTKAAQLVGPGDTALWSERVKRAARHLMAIGQALTGRADEEAAA